MNLKSSLFLALALLGFSATSQAQITFGGEPFHTQEFPAAHALPALDRATLAEEDHVTDRFKEAPWRFGVEHDVAWSCDEHGAWTLEQAHKVWRMVVDAPGATCMSVRFSAYDVPKGGLLFLYDAHGGDVLGALDHRNKKPWGGLATGVVLTEKLVVEYRQPIHIDAMPTLAIDQVVQGYRLLSGWPHGDDVDRGPFGNSGACNINVNCPEGATWTTEKRSVALIVQGGFAACSGGMVNNTANDGTPYFLTANHCLGNPGNWVYYFNHESATCNGNTGPTNQSVSGGTLLASSGQSDVALIELSQTPPADFNVQYAGWDASGTVPSSTVSIHHPSGDLKKICFDDDSPSQQNQFGAAVWYIDQWELGVTEGGSSGAPLFDQNHRVIGQLYGGGAACAGSVNNGQPDWYGRFDVSWGVGLSEYLDPAGTGALVWDGYPDGAISFENDASVNLAGAPEGLVCGVQPINLEVTLTNTGTSTLTSCMLEYTINDGATQNQSWAGSLAQFETDVITLPTFWSEGGTNTVEVNVTSPNGNDDDNVLNNTTTAEFSATSGPTTTIHFSLVLDEYPDETTWELVQLGQVLYEGGPYNDDQASETLMESFCLEEGCYIFRIFDDYEDGICCEYGEGSWSLMDIAGDMVWNGSSLATGGEFGASEQFIFCTDDISSIESAAPVQLQVYPVPARDVLHVKWPAAEGRATVRDAVGRSILHTHIGESQTLWNTSAWPAGPYTLEWLGTHGARKVVRLVVTH